jgi:uncharacterized repeat protein (TIGR02543 family)
MYDITYQDGISEVAPEITPFESVKYTGPDGDPTPIYKDNDGKDTPSHVGYRFAGWKDQDNNFYPTSQAVHEVPIPEKDTTYTAQWEKIKVTVDKEVVCGDNVVPDDVDHTVYFILLDENNTAVEVGGSVLYRHIDIIDGVPSGSAVFGESETIPVDPALHTLKVREVPEGSIEYLGPGNSEFHNNGKKIIVSNVRVDAITAEGRQQGQNDADFSTEANNQFVTVNTYSADIEVHDFEINKVWIDYKGERITPEDSSYTSTIGLYQKAGDTYTLYREVTLNGEVDDIETEAWKAVFTDLPVVNEEGDPVTYWAREISCTPSDFKAYVSDADNAAPMGENDYKQEGGTIYNKQDYFEVYHSSDGSKFQKLPVKSNTDLTKEVYDGYLYGGLFAYTETGDHKGDAIINECGKALNPEPGSRYYLKEVSNQYLKPQVYIISSTIHKVKLDSYEQPAELIRDLYGFVNIDDKDDYSVCGLISGSTPMASGDKYESVTFNYGSTKDTYTASRLYDTEGFLGVVHLGTGYIVDGQENWFTAYYETLDGVRVTGAYQRLLVFKSEGEDVYNNAPVFAGWTKSGGNTRTGLKAVSSDTNEVPTSGNDSIPQEGSFARTFTVFVPAEAEEYVITKIYDSVEEKQVVEAGDYTGKIAYAEKAGYMFAGWYLDPEFTNPADFADVNGNMTVYAKYISNSDVSFALKRKSLKKDTATFDVTVSVKNRDQLENVGISLVYKGNAVAAELPGKTVKKTGSGKNIKYTTQYKGTAAVKGLSLIDSFTGAVTWVTPDGTEVTSQARECRYILGIVTVR